MIDIYSMFGSSLTIEMCEMLGSSIMRLLIAVIILIAGKIIIPWLKEQRIYSTVVKFVRAADKLAQSGAITKKSKKKYVVQLLTAKGIKVTPEVEAFIEAAVTELDLAIESGLLLLPDFSVQEDGEECEDEIYPDETEDTVYEYDEQEEVI